MLGEMWAVNEVVAITRVRNEVRCSCVAVTEGEVVRYASLIVVVCRWASGRRWKR